MANNSNTRILELRANGDGIRRVDQSNTSRRALIVSNRYLDGRHFRKQIIVIAWTIRTGVNTPMAVRTKGDHKGRMIRTAIADPSYVVWFQIGRTIHSLKRSGADATFAVSVGARQNIVSDRKSVV